MGVITAAELELIAYENRRLLWRIARKYGIRDADADDLIRVAILELLPRVFSIVRPLGLLSVLVERRAHDEFRRRVFQARALDSARQGYTRLNGPADEDADDPSAEYTILPTPADVSQARVITTRLDVRAALDTLPRDDADLARRAYVLDETQLEMAADFGVDRSVLSRRLTSITATLRRALAAYAPPRRRPSRWPGGLRGAPGLPCRARTFWRSGFSHYP